MSLGFKSISRRCFIAAPAIKHSSIFSGSSAGMEDEYGNVIPSASIALAMVLAVYMRRRSARRRAASCARYLDADPR